MSVTNAQIDEWLLDELRRESRARLESVRRWARWFHGGTVSQPATDSAKSQRES